MTEHKHHNEHGEHSPHQGGVKPLRKIHDRKPSLDIIAGRQPVTEALKSGTLIEKIMILFGVKGPPIEKIRQLAKQNRVPVTEVGKQRFREIVSDTTTQGVVAIVGTKKYIEVEDILAAAVAKAEKPFLLVLDEIQDPQNLGALIRTAECAGVHGIIIPKHSAASVNQTVAKTSAGASEYMPVAKVTNIAVTLEELKKQGFWIVGTDSEGGKDYSGLDYSSPIVLVIGNEGSGIRKLVREKCDFLAKIPVFGNVESLNASVAGALVMYEVVRKRKGW